ncbi:MAG: hypothetical protein Q4A11_05045 [Brachymonas sp.]|nr:hypothetical protein [Brachymonas sp.]
MKYTPMMIGMAMMRVQVRMVGRVKNMRLGGGFRAERSAFFLEKVLVVATDELWHECLAQKELCWLVAFSKMTAAWHIL